MADYFYGVTAYPYVDDFFPDDIARADFSYMAIYKPDNNYDGICLFTSAPLTYADGKIGISDYVHFMRLFHSDTYLPDEWFSPSVGYGRLSIAADLFIWSNYDIIDTGNNSVYLAASDPVPVSPVQINPSALMQGFFVGDAIKRNR